MAKETELIFRATDPSLPATQELAASLEDFEFASSRARVSGAAASGSFILVLEALAQDGSIMVQSRIDQQFVVGDTVAASWAPFLRREPDVEDPVTGPRGALRVPGATWRKELVAVYLFPPRVEDFTATVIVADVLRTMPLWLPEGIVLDRIGTEVTGGVAATTVRLGLYQTDENGWPGTLELDAGTVSSATSGQKEITIAHTITVGDWYWLCAVANGGNPSLRVNNRGNPVFWSSASEPLPPTTGTFWGIIGLSAAHPNPGGALPSSFPLPAAGGGLAGFVPNMYVRVSP